MIERAALAAGARATIGRMTLHPDSRNVVPGRVWFSLDTRHDHEDQLAALAATMRGEAAAISARRGVAIAIEDFWISPATPFDATLVGHLRDAATARGIAAPGHADGHRPRRGLCRAQAAGGDALRALPWRAVSHNEAESITPGWAEAGLMVLADAVVAAAGVAKG